MMVKINLCTKSKEMKKDRELEIDFEGGYIVKPSFKYSERNDSLVDVDCFNTVKMRRGSLRYPECIEVEFAYLPNEGEPIRNDSNLHANVFNAIKNHRIRARHRARNMGLADGESDYFGPLEKRHYLFLDKEQALLVAFVTQTKNLTNGISWEKLGITYYYSKNDRNKVITATADFIMKKTQHLFTGREHNIQRTEYPLIIKFVDRMLPK